MKTLREMYENLCMRLLCIRHSEKGQTLVEYALILVLIALAAFAVIKLTGQTVSNTYSEISNKLQGR
jgi:Flp pilus assembly pilin Flp